MDARWHPGHRWGCCAPPLKEHARIQAHMGRRTSCCEHIFGKPHTTRTSSLAPFSCCEQVSSSLYTTSTSVKKQAPRSREYAAHKNAAQRDMLGFVSLRRNVSCEATRRDSAAGKGLQEH